MATASQLQRELDQLNARRNQIMNQQDAFTASQLREVGLLQGQIATLTSQIASLAANQNNAPAYGNVCVCTVYRSGKDDRSVEFPQGRTVADLLTSLGLTVRNVTVKRLLPSGSTIEIHSPSTSYLDEPEYKFFVSERVVGGC